MTTQEFICYLQNYVKERRREVIKGQENVAEPELETFLIGKLRAYDDIGLLISEFTENKL